MNRLIALLTVSLILTSVVTPIDTMAEANEPRDSPPVKIGFLNDATGPISYYADGFVSAALKAMQEFWDVGENFEIIFADSGCDGNTSISAAQSLVNAGVVAVAGAACSASTMGANSVLAPAGIPMVSYASTSPLLSDNNAYPSFYRIVPHDGMQAFAINATMHENGESDVALIFQGPASGYGPNIANVFEQAWLDGGNSLCANIQFPQTTTNFQNIVQQVINSGCGTVVIISFASNGAALIEELEYQGFSGQIYGSDGLAGLLLAADMSDASILNGIKTFKPAPNNITNSGSIFSSWCVNNTDCASGIYTAEAYDAVKLVGEAILYAQIHGVSIDNAIQYMGYGFEGASGPITLDLYGDQIEVGFSVCEFEYYTSNASISFVCSQVWYSPHLQSYRDSDGDGTPNLFDDCPADPNDWVDTDGDGVCNYSDLDDDGDGYTDDSDLFPLDSTEWIDTDGDGIGDNADLDDDNDGFADYNDDFPLDPSASTDTDNDGMPDTILANMTTDLTEDQDDDNDGYFDYEDAFPRDANEATDFDGDGIGDNSDWDDDNDGWGDTLEVDCETNQLDSSSIPSDYDLDGLCDLLDHDDDNDGRGDNEDAFPTDSTEWNDTDMDGIGNNADFDDDGDSWADIREEECGYDPLDSDSTPPDLDFDNECDELDPDDDGDMILDHLDEFPRNISEWSDNDQDGIGDNEDDDDDDDYWKDTAELVCETDPLNSSSFPPDHDLDGFCDGVDNDDDNDGTVDESDVFPFNSDEWIDTDSDGIGNNADLDDDGDMLSDEIELQKGTDPLNHDTDGDGYYDSIDDLPLDPKEWSDSDKDGVGDNSDNFPSIARYQNTTDILLDLVLVGLLGCLGLLISRLRSED